MKNVPLGRLLSSMVIVGCTGCGDSDANVVAEIGWSFNYRDWTKPDTQDDVRGCNNAPPTTAGPSYAAVAQVNIAIEDPAGQVPPFIRDFDCDRGAGDTREKIKGLLKQVYTLTLSGKNADGTVMYKHVVENYDLSTLQSNSFELRTVVGEVSFFPRYPGSSLTCPGGVETIRWQATVQGETDVVASATQDACDISDLSNELYVRNLASEPEPNVTGGFVPVNYDVEVAALDAGGSVLYCGSSVRPISPGGGNLGGDQNLTAGDCL